MRHRIGLDSFPGEISLHNSYVTEYLVTEILAKQSEDLTDCLVKSSILERFCADLCEAVCSGGSDSAGEGSTRLEFNGDQYLEWLQASNLFVIPLDDQNEWFRYHHLFRYTLQQELGRRLHPDDIRDLHKAAGRWCGQNSLIEEALIHLLAAGDIAEAIGLVAEHRYRMMNADRWLHQERWLNLFSQEVIENSAELWMLKTWLVYHSGLWFELSAYLERLASIMANDPDQEITIRLAGEISVLRSLIAYHSGDAEEAITYARQAIASTPSKFWVVRVQARTYLGLGLLLSGDESGGYHAFYDAFHEERVQNKRFKATLLMAACYFHWIAADLQGMEQAARQSIAICPPTGFRSIEGYGKYNLGRVCYQKNDLSAAEELFASIVAKPYQNYGDCYTSSACGLAMTYQALGRAAKARQVTEETIAFLLETGNTTQLPVARALQADLALKQGQLPAANQWADKLDHVPPLGPTIGFIAPHLTLIKVWLAINNPTSLDKAARLLNQLGQYVTGVHHTRLQIEILATQALWEAATGDQPAALKSLEKALRLAQPGGFIRLFVDLGPAMAALLSSMNVDRGLLGYIDRIRSAFPRSQQTTASMDQESFLGNLTNRELQVLELLGEHQTNKEIASQLVIAPGTVKAHTIRIYQKLGVRGRRQAVQKAIALGILTPN
jgi:LuxR family maltose regulon positive regulatory protein